MELPSGEKTAQEGAFIRGHHKLLLEWGMEVRKGIK